MMLYILMGATVVGIAGMIFGATMLFTNNDDQINDRLDTLTSNRGRGVTKTDSHPKTPKI